MADGSCIENGCDKPIFVKKRGWCRQHYQHWWRTGSATRQPRGPQRPKDALCEAPDCTRVHDADGLCRMHYERRRKHGSLGSPHPVKAPKGAGSNNGKGYRVITVNGRSVLEHRHVMARHLGRPLRRGETVHHRDGNRSRNTIDNLELWASAQPYGQRAVDLLTWAEEIVARYAPERDKL